jgi:hypothetical protein
LITNTIEKRTGFSTNEGNTLTKVYDPFLNRSFRGGNGGIEITLAFDGGNL